MSLNRAVHEYMLGGSDSCLLTILKSCVRVSHTCHSLSLPMLCGFHCRMLSIGEDLMRMAEEQAMCVCCICIWCDCMFWALQPLFNGLLSCDGYVLLVVMQLSCTERSTANHHARWRGWHIFGWLPRCHVVWCIHLANLSSFSMCSPCLFSLCGQKLLPVSICRRNFLRCFCAIVRIHLLLPLMILRVCLEVVSRGVAQLSIPLWWHLPLEDACDAFYVDQFMICNWIARASDAAIATRVIV